MKYLIFTDVFFCIIVSIITILIDIYGKENRKISIVLWCLIVICFAMASFLNGIIHGKYNLSNSAMIIVTLLSVLLYNVFIKIGNFVVSRFLQ